ncbi:MAG: DUF4159 domain-containing protein [Candidatus Omnitrophota bacterium]|jgi:hypothetical protein
MKKIIFVIIAALAVFFDLSFAEERVDATCGPAPRPEAASRKAAEGTFPLPLPGPPLRRTEKKRPPSPPLLMAKVEFRDTKEWVSDPGDADNLMNKAKKILGIWYRHVNMPSQELVNRFNANVKTKTPVLYLSGHNAFDFTKEEQDALRQYLIDGGSLIGDACCGKQEFKNSFVNQMRAIFPDREFPYLQADHPLFSSFYKIDKVKRVVYDAAGNKSELIEVPKIRGLNIGCRTAVFLTESDVSCGLDGHTHTYGDRYAAEDAAKISVNMLAYILAENKLAKFQATTTTVKGTSPRPRQEFKLAVLKHSGDWDPNPNSFPALTRELAANTNLSVNFEREETDLKDVNIYKYPFLFITGKKDPRLTKEELSILRQYVISGGFILIDNCCGRKEFDVASRDFIAKIVPESKLERLPKDHAIYNSFYKISRVKHTFDDKDYLPELEAVTVNGKAMIVYSPLSLNCSWKRMECPYCNGIDADDSLRLMTNIIVYAMQN